MNRVLSKYVRGRNGGKMEPHVSTKREAEKSGPGSKTNFD